jgi:hypothetical protein
LAHITGQSAEVAVVTHEVPVQVVSKLPVGSPFSHVSVSRQYPQDVDAVHAPQMDKLLQAGQSEAYHDQLDPAHEVSSLPLPLPPSQVFESEQ